jgi:DNA-directed RNA polymerase specialized sigma54-like protein
MRLSFGQEMRMAQKQILAPRMIQSMEILQLPILALEERIEQEIQENEALDVQELDPDLPEEEQAEQVARPFRRAQPPFRHTAGRRRGTQARCNGQCRRSAGIAERLSASSAKLV